MNKYRIQNPNMTGDPKGISIVRAKSITNVRNNINKLWAKSGYPKPPYSLFKITKVRTNRKKGLK
jgi:hypothetical protein